MSFQLQEWERGMSSMLPGSKRLGGLLGPSWGVLASMGTSLPQPFPKVCVVIFDQGTEAISLRRGLEEQSLGAVLQEPPRQHQAVPVYGDWCRYPDLLHRPLPAGASPPVIPVVADYLVSKKSEIFYSFNGVPLHPRLPHAAASPETRWGGWRLKGKLQGSAIRSYRMRALSNCPQLETVPLLRHVFRQEAEPGRP